MNNNNNATRLTEILKCVPVEHEPSTDTKSLSLMVLKHCLIFHKEVEFYNLIGHCPVNMNSCIVEVMK